jgi:hypothetical protein
MILKKIRKLTNQQYFHFPGSNKETGSCLKTRESYIVPEAIGFYSEYAAVWGITFQLIPPWYGWLLSSYVWPTV